MKKFLIMALAMLPVLVMGQVLEHVRLTASNDATNNTGKVISGYVKQININVTSTNVSLTNSVSLVIPTNTHHRTEQTLLAAQTLTSATVIYPVVQADSTTNTAVSGAFKDFVIYNGMPELRVGATLGETGATIGVVVDAEIIYERH